MSSSPESEDVPMVDAEEHLPSTQLNGNMENDQMMENGEGSEGTLKAHENISKSPHSKSPKPSKNTSANQSSSEEREASRGPTHPQPGQDVQMSDSLPSSIQNSKAAEAAPAALNGLTVSKNGDSTQSNNFQETAMANGQPQSASDPKINGTNGHTESGFKSNGLPSSVGADANAGQPTPKKQTVASVEDASKAEAEINRFHKDTAMFRETMEQALPKSAQIFLRENWRAFLFEPFDETHVAFILRAGLKNSNSAVLRRVLKDDNIFKPSFIETASQKPAMRKQVLEGATLVELLSDVPPETLDELVAHRIRTAPVKQLASWLTKGKRLGFEEDDVISEQHDELLVPNIPPPQYRHPAQPEYRSTQQAKHGHVNGMGMGMDPTPGNMDALLAEQNRQRDLALQRVAAQRQALATPQVPQQGNLSNHPGPLECSECKYVFSNYPGYHHHITKKPCAKDPPPGGFKWSCPNCLQGFTTKQGSDYHRLKGVCTNSDIVPSSPAIQTPPAIPSNDGLPRPSSTPVYVQPPVQGPSQAPWVSQQQQRPQAAPPYSQQLPQTRPSTSAVDVVSPPPPPPRQSAPPVVASVEVVIPSPKAKKVPPMPPLHTPAPPASQTSTFHSSPPTTRKQAPRKDVRVDPSDLPPDKLARLNRELAEQDQKYEEGVAELADAVMDPELKENRITSLKNANSSKKSQIRKSYGVTLRMRDKDKQYRNSTRSSMTANNTGGSSSPTGSAATTPAPTSAPTPVSRPRINDMRGPPAANSPLAAVAGFPPVNAPTISGFSPVNRPNPNRNGTHTPPTSGFGVLKTQKRRHELPEHERRPGSGAGGYTGGIPTSLPSSGMNGSDSGSGSGSGSGLAMVEMGSQVASEKYRDAKEKVKVHAAGAHADSATSANGTISTAHRASSSGPLIVIDDSEDEGEGEGKSLKAKEDKD